VKISDVWGVFICEVEMPYLNADDPKLPDNIKELPKDKREQWVAIFNDVYESAIDDEKTEEEAEKLAFTQANGVVFKKNPDKKSYRLMDKVLAGIEQGEELKKQRTFIFLPVTEAVGKQLGITDPNTLKKAHITVLYLNELSPREAGLVEDLIINKAKEIPPIGGRINGAGRFSLDEKDAFVALVDSPTLSNTRQKLMGGIADLGYISNVEHGFIPHITISYLDKTEKMPEKRFDPDPLFFDKIGFGFGDEQILHPLTGNTGQDELYNDIAPPNLHRSLGHTKCVLCVYFLKKQIPLEDEEPEIKTYCKLYKTQVAPYQVCDDYINTQAFLTSKAYEAKAGMRNSAKDMEIVQGLHDGTCKLGATCKSRHLEEMVMKRAIPLARAPIAPRETKWDSGAAHKRAVEWATTDDSLNLDKYARLHLYVMGDGENITDYKLQYQDIVDGKPTIIPQSVITIANNPQRGLEAVKEIPEEDKTKIKANLSRLFARMRDDLEDFDLKPRWEQTEGKANIQPVPKEHNALQPIGFDEEGNFIAKNHLVLFDKTDLEGTVNSRKNPDGSKGEHFTKETDFESSYTKTNNVLLDWEHRQGGKNEPGPHDPLGRVNWKTVEKDDEGLFAEIVLEKRARYFNMLVELIENGLLATSTEPVQGQVVKSTDGEIKKWPMFRNTLTPTPMELSMYDPRQLELYRKAAEVIPAFAKSLSNVEIENAKIKAQILEHINKNNLLLLQGV
jgi:2'-5' RNA ligase